MAQTGYTPISIYYSATTTNVPTAGNLVAGELAINTADGKLFYKDSSGVVQIIASKTAATVAGSTTQVIYNNAGAYAGSANMTFNGTTLTLANDASISGLTVGKGLAGVATNTAVGASALAANTSADNSTAIGYQSAINQTTGGANTAIGASALRTNTTGYLNTVVGCQAMYSNTTGTNNHAIGFQALYNNTTAANNVAIGYQALYSTSLSGSNVAIGYQAGYSHNTGSLSGSSNTFVGTSAGYAATTGYTNTFIGYNAGSTVTTGLTNTIIGTYNGNQNGLDIRTASGYIVLSDGSGQPRYYFDAASGDWILNQLNAGYYCLMRYKNQTGAYFSVGTQAGASPNFQIYNPSGGGVYLGYSASSWTGVSDERLKNITGEISDGLNKVNQLRAVEFTWKKDETNESQVGLIAQDVQAVLPQAIGENDGYLGVRYTEVIPLLVAAIKELKAEFDAYKATHP